VNYFSASIKSSIAMRLRQGEIERAPIQRLLDDNG